MSPSGLGWLQGSVFFILGVLAPSVWHRVRKCRTQHTTSDADVELHSIRVQNDTSTDPFEGEQPSELHLTEQASPRVARKSRIHELFEPSSSSSDSPSHSRSSSIESDHIDPEYMPKEYVGVRHRKKYVAAIRPPKEYIGVRYCHDRKKYVAEIRPPKRSKKIWLGMFNTAEEAACAFDIAYRKLDLQEEPPLELPGLAALAAQNLLPPVVPQRGSRHHRQGGQGGPSRPCYGPTIWPSKDLRNPISQSCESCKITRIEQ